MLRRIFVVGLLTSFLFCGSVASAETVAEIQARISDLVLLIQNLQVQLAAQRSETTLQPPAPLATNIVAAITLVSPNGGESFTLGQPIEIAWKGGSGNVQVGLVDAKYEADKTVLGWISLSAQPDGSLVWTGSTVSDITGTVIQDVSSLSPGPFKVVVISDGTGKDYCVLSSNSCNFDLSDSYFAAVFPPHLPSLFELSCSPSAQKAEAGSVVTWEASASNGHPPYVFNWSGADRIASLPTRPSPTSTSTPNGAFLDVVYSGAGVKTAQVTAYDANGDKAFASCSSPVTVTPASSLLAVVSPNGGEQFVLTKSSDPSQSVPISWRTKKISGMKDAKVRLAFLDEWGSVCALGSAPYAGGGTFVSLIDGYVCPGNNYMLTPGRYKVRISLEGKEATVYGISDAYFTLASPVSDLQAIAPSALVLKSGESVKFRLLYPPNAVKTSLHLSCPFGITASTSNACNTYTNIPVASSTEYATTFSNASAQAQVVSANYYVYLPNNPNYGRGMRAEITVLPVRTATESSITVLAPNGGEKILFGAPSVFRFKTSRTGLVDLTLTPYPPIDAGLVCQIAKGVPALSDDGVTLTIKETGSCLNNLSKKITAGTYKLLAVLREFETKLATDESDASFTIMAPSTGAQ